jgi:hypothetical protein
MNKLIELLHDYQLFKNNYKGYLTNTVLNNHLSLIGLDIMDYIFNPDTLICESVITVKKKDFQELCEMLNNLYSQQINNMTGRAPLFSKQKAADLKAGYADGALNMGKHLLAKLNIKLED